MFIERECFTDNNGSEKGYVGDIYAYIATYLKYIDTMQMDYIFFCF